MARMIGDLVRRYRNWADDPKNVDKTDEFLRRMWGNKSDKEMEQMNDRLDKYQERFYIGLLAVCVGLILKDRAGK